jgi:hypothetical protein
MQAEGPTEILTWAFEAVLLRLGLRVECLEVSECCLKRTILCCQRSSTVACCRPRLRAEKKVHLAEQTQARLGWPWTGCHDRRSAVVRILRTGR